MIPLTSPASRKRVLFGHWPFALLSSAPGSVWACGGASLVVAENGGGRGGMPDHNGPTFEEITSGVRFRNRSPPLRSPLLAPALPACFFSRQRMSRKVAVAQEVFPHQPLIRFLLHRVPALLPEQTMPYSTYTVHHLVGNCRVSRFVQGQPAIRPKPPTILGGHRLDSSEQDEHHLARGNGRMTLIPGWLDETGQIVRKQFPRA